MEEVKIEKGEILSVSCSDDGKYSVIVNQGSSVEEVAFAITVILKVFDRDGVIKKEKMLELIDKYLHDVQYEELKS